MERRTAFRTFPNLLVQNRFIPEMKNRMLEHPYSAETFQPLKSLNKLEPHSLTPTKLNQPKDDSKPSWRLHKS